MSSAREYLKIGPVWQAEYCPARDRCRSALARLLSAAAVCGTIGAWGPKLVHLAMSWRELGHVACEAPLLPDAAHLALLVTATACEVWEILHHSAEGPGHRTEPHAKALFLIWILLLVGGALCKGAHLFASWAMVMGVPCRSQAGLLLQFFSPLVQLAVLAAASAWTIGDLFGAILHGRRHHHAAEVTAVPARSLALPLTAMTSSLLRAFTLSVTASGMAGWAMPGVAAGGLAGVLATVARCAEIGRPAGRARDPPARRRPCHGDAYAGGQGPPVIVSPAV